MKKLIIALIAAAILSTGCTTTDIGKVKNTDTSRGALGVAEQYAPAEWSGALKQARKLLVGSDPLEGYERNITWMYKGEPIEPRFLEWEDTFTKRGGLNSMPGGSALGPMTNNASIDPDAAAKAKIAEDLGAIIDAIEVVPDAGGQP